MKKINKGKQIFKHYKIEKKWQKKWKEEGLYELNLKSSKKPFYNLMMFPYPSAEGLHVGNMYAFTGADVFARLKRMEGKDLFEPIGLDGFGIHSENYAIKIGRHPKENSKISEKNFYKQLHLIGNGYSWRNKLETYDPSYYRWTQWIFIQIFKAGLAYKGKAEVNWCPSCKTVLADEQVIDGKCERCKNLVGKREMASWYFRITKYADRLLENIDGKKANKDFGPVDKDYDVRNFGLRWPEKIKIAQKNWIGKKEWIDIEYQIDGLEGKIVVSTTRPDTNFGATFIVVAPEFAKENLLTVIPEGKKEEIEKYINISLNKSYEERISEGRKKTGVFSGLYAVNQLNNYKMPIWVADFVLMSVGTGAVVGVPGHDRRDFEFAKQYNLPVIRVVVGKDQDTSEITKLEQVQEEEGVMTNSGFLDGLEINEAIGKMMDYIEEKGWGKRIFRYHLRDWLISRQRYWGPPIPMIFCRKCAGESKSWKTEQQNTDKFNIENGENKTGDWNWNHFGWYPVPEKDLPVMLPDIKDFKPKGDGISPLHNAPIAWKKVKCPNCGGSAERELDVSDTFLDSSWYFLAYPNLNTSEWMGVESPFNRGLTKKWLPVDAYIGGAEHAVLHLLYARFVTMVLKDLKYIDFEEPFPFLFGHGLLIKDGAKMSKSRGNIVNPDTYIEKFGADTLRLYLMFLGPYDQGGDFRDTGIEGMRRFVERVWRIYQGGSKKLSEKDKTIVYNKLHQTIKKVSEDIQGFKFNTAIASIMEFVNLLMDKGADGKTLKILALLLAPFAPHLTEEVWIYKLGEKMSIHSSSWPKYDPEMVKEDTLTIAVQVNGKLRGTIEAGSEKSEDRNWIIESAKQDEKVKKWLEGKEIINEIYVPGRLVNFVV